MELIMKIMIISAIIIGIILLFLVFFASYVYNGYANNEEDGKFGVGLTLGVVITMLSFIECILVGFIFSEPYPTAMDVYQGRTTLEYKVVDDVKVDSVVIFKNEDYGSN